MTIHRPRDFIHTPLGGEYSLDEACFHLQQDFASPFRPLNELLSQSISETDRLGPNNGERACSEHTPGNNNTVISSVSVVGTGLFQGDHRAHDHEHRAEEDDGLVQGDLRHQPSLRSQALQEADVEHRRDDVVCAGPCFQEC